MKRTLTTTLLLLAMAAAAHAGDPAMPNPKLTRGAVGTLTARELCSSHFHTASVRAVSATLKRKVCDAYGIKGECPDGRYEIDHLISLELGGTNDAANLWPQPYAPPGAHQKDLVENWLHRQLCKGNISLPDAQHQIATDWYAVFRRMTVEQQQRSIGSR